MAKRTCSEPGCDDPHKSRGYCGKHYMFHLNRGDLVPIKSKGRTAEEAQPFIDGGVCKVPLTRGLFAVVDIADMDLVSGRPWQAEVAHLTFYATRRAEGPRGVKRVKMHRLILGLSEGELDADHVDGDGLNNRRSNLRRATDSQNQANRVRMPPARSAFRGVTNEGGRWRARIRVDGKLLNFGSHETEEAAARAYDAAASELFGEFARLNFPDDPCGYEPLGT